jgi:hypothetical protein
MQKVTWYLRVKHHTPICVYGAHTSPGGNRAVGLIYVKFCACLVSCYGIRAPNPQAPDRPPA